MAGSLEGALVVFSVGLAEGDLVVGLDVVGLTVEVSVGASDDDWLGVSV